MSASTDTQAAVESEVETCTKCGRASVRHGRKLDAGVRTLTCADLAATETRELFTKTYMQTPWWRRWRLRAPEGW